jgi:hypothetical protein
MQQIQERQSLQRTYPYESVTYLQTPEGKLLPYGNRRMYGKRVGTKTT